MRLLHSRFIEPIKFHKLLAYSTRVGRLFSIVSQSFECISRTLSVRSSSRLISIIACVRVNLYVNAFLLIPLNSVPLLLLLPDCNAFAVSFIFGQIQTKNEIEKLNRYFIVLH